MDARFCPYESLMKESNIYLQEESVYEPVGEKEKAESKRKCRKLPRIGDGTEEPGHPWRQSSAQTGKYLRVKILLAVLFIAVLILALCGLGVGLAKYSTKADEIKSLKKELNSANSLGSFLLYNEDRKRCAEVRSTNSPPHLDLTASTCAPESVSQLFRWIPGGRLLSLKTRQCLGVKGTPQSLFPLIFLACDNGKALSWTCTNETLLGVKGQSLYFNYGNNPRGIVMLYAGTGPWSRWKARDTDGKLQKGGACAQTCDL
ncbi:uncharacterized protein RCH25_018136 [Pelodytes ibericus]